MGKIIVCTVCWLDDSEVNMSDEGAAKVKQNVPKQVSKRAEEKELRLRKTRLKEQRFWLNLEVTLRKMLGKYQVFDSRYCCCMSPFVLISNRLFVYLGEISFSLYLLHPMLVYGLKPVYSHIYSYAMPLGLAFLICVVVTLLLLVPLAHIVYKVVESKSIYTGNWLIRNRLSSF